MKIDNVLVNILATNVRLIFVHMSIGPRYIKVTRNSSTYNYHIQIDTKKQ